MERIKEWLTYWYFYFPKWLWASVIVLLLIVFHVWVGNTFPAQWLWESEREETWVLRVGAFYLAIMVVGILLIIVSGAVFLIVGGIYTSLPDDPRKQKDDSQP